MRKARTPRVASDHRLPRVADVGHTDAQDPAHAPLTVTDPATLPDRYVVRIDGACLEPDLPHGTPVLIEKNGKIAAGDFAVLFFKPEHVPAGKYQAILKRVVMAPPPYVKFPFREHPQSDVHALVIVEMTNPPRRFAYKCEHLLGIHKCIGPIPASARKSLTVAQGAHCGANGPPALRVIGGNREQKAASVAEIAAVKFAAIKEFRGRTKMERLKRVHGIVDDVRALATVAAEIVAMNKEELIAKTSERYDQLGPLLMQLAHGRDDACLLMELIGSAETRLAVALANVEGEDE